MRHSNAVVMAPALTDAGQSQNFTLPPSSPINAQNGDYVTDGQRKDDGKYSEYAGLIKRKDRATKLRRATPEGDAALCQIDTIMNHSPHMDDHETDTMGLQKGMEAVASLQDKNVNDVDQLLTNFEMPPGDISQVDDLMQVINMDATPSAPAELAFPIAFERDLFSEVDMISICEDELSKETRARETIEELHKKQLKLERRSEFLLRRLRKLQVRAMGKHVSSEVVGLFEHIHRSLRRSKEPEVDPAPDPLPVTANTMKKLLKKLEASTVVGGKRTTSRYFGSGSVEYARSVSAPRLTAESGRELSRVAGLLNSELNIVERQLDSDATASSSGGESCDEMQTYNNPHQQLLST